MSQRRHKRELVGPVASVTFGRNEATVGGQRSGEEGLENKMAGSQDRLDPTGLWASGFCLM